LRSSFTTSFTGLSLDRLFLDATQLALSGYGRFRQFRTAKFNSTS
jgi:hypothetical protein